LRDAVADLLNRRLILSKQLGSRLGEVAGCKIECCLMHTRSFT
jgi:hypothetical protein